MSDLVKFLTARLDEDERLAHSATGGPWRYDPTKVNSVDRGEAVFAGSRGLDAVTVASVGPADDPQSMADGAYIARWDPARVLAEVDAKRQIIEEHQPQPWHVNVGGRDEIPEGTPYCGRCGDGEWYAVAAPCPTLKLLALPYADHPDYRQEWKP